MPTTSKNLSKKHIDAALCRVLDWFQSLGHTAFPFQRKTWRHYLSRGHGLVYAQTGTGKTLAAFLGPVIEQIATNPCELDSSTSRRMKSTVRKQSASRLKVLWITPLRALASDTENSLRQAVEALEVDWVVEKRTSDVSASVRARQSKSLPEVLVTTPESITLQLTRDDCAERFSQLKLIVVDEWHELMGTKRGVQTELALSRLRAIKSTVRVWGLSATIGNIDEALAALVFPDSVRDSAIVRGNVSKKTEIIELIPKEIERFPWAGHLGARMIPQVCEIIRSAKSALVFTNTRSQSEIWYRELLKMMPDLAGQMAVHHGSLDQKLRGWVEDQLREGKLRCCVCTSSLELGVDFPVVDQVIQIGSPKGVARMLQRAGRSGHQPGGTSRITFVPTNALELIEISALKQAISNRQLEKREPVRAPLDVLAQHLITVALGGGFRASELLSEVRRTQAFSQLTDEEWQWTLDFVERGGSSLKAYPDYHRLQFDGTTYRVVDRRIAALHRMSIGTIVGDASIEVRYMRGKAIGTIEEAFIGRLSPGDCFTLGGKLVELVRVHDNTAWVKRAKEKATSIPRWMGGRMPLSNELSQAFRQQLTNYLAGNIRGKSMQAVKPLLDLQKSWSIVPGDDELLIECWKSRDGYHVFAYPFEGRLVHEGLAALWALRLAKIHPISFAMSMNDYGCLLVSPTEPPLNQCLATGLLSLERVTEDILGSLNATEMSRRQFREVARIAGLVFQGYPGQRKLSRHLQASSNLFFDVFSEYDPQNLLLNQAKHEVLDRQLQQQRLIASLERMNRCRVVIQQLNRPTPLAFPLLVDRLQDRLSTESFTVRVQRMLASLQKEAPS